MNTYKIKSENFNIELLFQDLEREYSKVYSKISILYEVIRLLNIETEEFYDNNLFCYKRKDLPHLLLQKDLAFCFPLDGTQLNDCKSEDLSLVLWQRNKYIHFSLYQYDKKKDDIEITKKINLSGKIISYINSYSLREKHIKLLDIERDSFRFKEFQDEIYKNSIQENPIIIKDHNLSKELFNVDSDDFSNNNSALYFTFSWREFNLLHCSNKNDYEISNSYFYENDDNLALGYKTGNIILGDGYIGEEEFVTLGYLLEFKNDRIRFFIALEGLLGNTLFPKYLLVRDCGIFSSIMRKYLEKFIIDKRL